MWSSLRHVLPILFPSWRFFQSVEASPRIEWRAHPDTPDATGWQALTPCPARLSVSRLIGQVVWNPARNDALFMLTCAERILSVPSPTALREIEARIRRAAAPRAAGLRAQFRIRLVQQQDDGLTSEVAYLSAPFDVLP